MLTLIVKMSITGRIEVKSKTNELVTFYSWFGMLLNNDGTISLFRSGYEGEKIDPVVIDYKKADKFMPNQLSIIKQFLLDEFDISYDKKEESSEENA